MQMPELIGSLHDRRLGRFRCHWIECRRRQQQGKQNEYTSTMIAVLTVCRRWLVLYNNQRVLEIPRLQLPCSYRPASDDGQAAWLGVIRGCEGIRWITAEIRLGERPCVGKTANPHHSVTPRNKGLAVSPLGACSGNCRIRRLNMLRLSIARCGCGFLVEFEEEMLVLDSNIAHYGALYMHVFSQCHLRSSPGRGAARSLLLANETLPSPGTR